MLRKNAGDLDSSHVSFYLCTYFYFDLLGLHCCMGFSTDVGSGAHSLVVVLGLLVVVASLFTERGW